MKKVLILAYDFPPYVSVGGLRPYNWLKYLKEFDVEPIVITRQWSNVYGNELDYIAPSESKEILLEKFEYGTIMRAPYFPSLSNRLLLKHGEQKLRLFRKILTAIVEVRQFLWVSGPKKQLYLAAKRYLRDNKVDAIIATGEPFVVFSFASRLSADHEIPWIADYRDSWSQNKIRQKNQLYFRWTKYIERKIVANATSIVTVSEFISCKLKEFFPTKTVHVLPNGYNPDVIEIVSNITQETQQLTFSYIGTIYSWHPWKSFIEQFALFLENNPEFTIRINFYGINISNEVSSFIKKFSFKIQSSIILHPKMQNEELLKNVAKENVMLLFNDYSYLGTKIYDYLGVNRKVIMCYANDRKALELKKKYYSIEEIEGISKNLQADLIEETNSGIIVENEQHLQQVFKDLMSEFIAKDKIDCESYGVEKYSRKNQVEKLANVISLIKSRVY